MTLPLRITLAVAWAATIVWSLAVFSRFLQFGLWLVFGCLDLRRGAWDGIGRAVTELTGAPAAVAAMQFGILVVLIAANILTRTPARERVGAALTLAFGAFAWTTLGRGLDTGEIGLVPEDLLRAVVRSFDTYYAHDASLVHALGASMLGCATLILTLVWRRIGAGPPVPWRLVGALGWAAVVVLVVGVGGRGLWQSVPMFLFAPRLAHDPVAYAERFAWTPDSFGLRVGQVLLSGVMSGYVLVYVAPVALALVLARSPRWRFVRWAAGLCALGLLVLASNGVGHRPGCCICHPEWPESALLLLLSAPAGLLRPRWGRVAARPGASGNGPWVELPSGSAERR